MTERAEGQGRRASTLDRRWYLLFAVLVAIHLLPIWTVELIPTVDGPSHLYNAFVLQQLTRGAPELERVFELNLRPVPNWLGHALLFALLYVAPPVVAEKLVVSLIVALFLIGTWTLAGLLDERNRLYVFLAAPLTYHVLLQMGFYNYALGAALVPFIVVLAWRRRIIAAGVILLVCYFAHPVPAALAMLLAVVIAVVRHTWRDLVALIPTASLLVWFALQPYRPGGDWTWNGALLFEPLWRAAFLMTFDLRQLVFGTAIGAVYGIAIVATLWIERERLRERGLLLLLAAISLAVYLAAPISVDEGLILKARLIVFPYLLLLPWLTPRLLRTAIVAVFFLVASLNALYIERQWRINAAFMQESLAVTAAAEPQRTVVPLIFDRSSPHAMVPLLSHAFSYAAVRRLLVDYSNYEASHEFFPVRFRDGVRRPDRFALQSAPQEYQPAAFVADIDYIYTWRMPQGSDVERRIEQFYAPVRIDGDARLYRRRP